jgi:hypothetical protein
MVIGQAVTEEDDMAGRRVVAKHRADWQASVFVRMLLHSTQIRIASKAGLASASLPRRRPQLFYLIPRACSCT